MPWLTVHLLSQTSSDTRRRRGGGQAGEQGFALLLGLTDGARPTGQTKSPGQTACRSSAAGDDDKPVSGLAVWKRNHIMGGTLLHGVAQPSVLLHEGRTFAKVDTAAWGCTTCGAAWGAHRCLGGHCCMGAHLCLGRHCCMGVHNIFPAAWGGAVSACEGSMACMHASREQCLHVRAPWPACMLQGSSVCMRGLHGLYACAKGAVSA
eukprot:366073-Chlamydomonas_euryale.AAC.10